MGPAFVGIITGSMVTENYLWLGQALGSFFVTARQPRLPLVLKASDHFVGALTILFNAIVDVLLCRYRPENSLLILELAMMCKKNSETLVSVKS